MKYFFNPLTAILFILPILIGALQLLYLYIKYVAPKLKKTTLFNPYIRSHMEMNEALKAYEEKLSRLKGVEKQQLLTKKPVFSKKINVRKYID